MARNMREDITYRWQTSSCDTERNDKTFTSNSSLSLERRSCEVGLKRLPDCAGVASSSSSLERLAMLDRHERRMRRKNIGCLEMMSSSQTVAVWRSRDSSTRIAKDTAAVERRGLRVNLEARAFSLCRSQLLYYNDNTPSTTDWLAFCSAVTLQPLAMLEFVRVGSSRTPP
jgi:hypothetical protein